MLIQIPDELRWVQKQEDIDLLMAILNIQDIAENLAKLGLNEKFVESQKVEALGVALEKTAGDLLNLARERKPNRKKISKKVLSDIKVLLPVLIATVKGK